MEFSEVFSRVYYPEQPAQVECALTILRGAVQPQIFFGSVI